MISRANRRLATAILCCCAGVSAAQVSSIGFSSRTAPETPGAVLSRLADLDFEVMGTKQGLPHDSVYGFAQDSLGYLWIATFGGLSRYDGYHLRNYIHDAHDPHSLPDNNIRVLIPGKDGSLWIGTGNAGVITYDPREDDFHPLPGFPAILKRAHIFCMALDHEGGLWFGSQLGLAHYDARTHQYRLFGRAAAGDGKNGFTLGSVFSVFEDSQGNLWVGGDSGLLIRRRGKSTFEPIHGLEGPGQIGVSPSIWTIFEDSHHRMWIGADKTGLGRFDPATDLIEGVPNLAGEKSLIGAATVRGIVETAPDQFWIATYGSGLILLNADTMESRRYLRDLTSANPLSNDFVRGILLDRSGVVWLGTDRGLSRVNSFSSGLLNIHASPLREHGLRGNEVRSVTAQGDRIWVGFDQGGIAVIEPDGTIRNVEPAPGVRPDQQLRREVLALKASPDGKIYAGGEGLYEIDPTTLTYRPLPSTLLTGQVINALLIDGPDVWAATYNGLVRYNRVLHTARLYAHQVGDPSSLSDNYVRDLLKTADGRIWVTTRLGLDCLDPTSDRFVHIRHNPSNPSSLPDDNIQPIAQDFQGRLWIGTIGDGLTVLENPGASTPRFHTFTPADGFPGGIVLTVMRGKDGRIWSNTPNGLAVIDPGTYKIRTYTAADGLQTSSQNLFSSATLRDGTIVFPGDQGLTVVRPALLDDIPRKAPLVLSELSMMGDNGSPAAAAWSTLQNGIRLSPERHGFHASVALLDYTEPDAVLYSYELQGFDPTWSQLSTENRSITYTNLPAGHYRLLVHAASRLGSGPSADISIPVLVIASWWESWWFHLIEILALAALIVAAVRVRIQVSHKRQLALEKEVQQRTAELAQKQTELLKANKLLFELATRDPLTGALNRREFLANAERELERTRRTGRPFTLLLIDVDHFKSVNDRYGHIAGDAVLRSIVTSLSGQLRRTDFMARYGGEELVVFLADTTLDNCSLLAERLRTTALDHIVEIEGDAISITISIGAAEASPTETIDDILRRADEALYAAKHAGRNQVMYSNPTSTRPKIK